MGASVTAGASVLYEVLKMVIRYIERKYIDRFSCMDKERVLNCDGCNVWQSGGLIYIKNGFNIKTIDSYMVISIDGVRGAYAERHNIAI